MTDHTVPNEELAPIDAAADDAKLKASEYMRWLSAAQHELNEANAIFDYEVAVLEERRGDVTHGLTVRVETLTGLLEGFALAFRARTDKASVELPYGKVSTRAGSQSLDVFDEKALLEWAALQDEDSPPVTVTSEPKTTVSKTNINTGIQAKTLIVTADRIVTAAGVPVPGVRQVTGDTKPTVEVTP